MLAVVARSRLPEQKAKVLTNVTGEIRIMGLYQQPDTNMNILGFHISK